MIINNSDTNTSLIAEGNNHYLIIHSHEIWLEIGGKYGK